MQTTAGTFKCPLTSDVYVMINFSFQGCERSNWNFSMWFFANDKKMSK